VPGCPYPISDKRGDPNIFEVDHIQAISNNGSNEVFNIQILCRTHNRQQSDRDEYEWAREHGMLFPK